MNNSKNYNNTNYDDKILIIKITITITIKIIMIKIFLGQLLSTLSMPSCPSTQSLSAAFYTPVKTSAENDN